MEHGLSHGDIKPENIMFTMEEDGNIKLKLIDWATWIDIVNINQPNTPMYFNNPKYRDPKTGKVMI